MEWVEIIGWVAVLATITTYAVRTMLPLRLLALLANLFFLIYGALAPIYPTMVMYALLLPINLYRIYDIQRTTRQMKDIKPDEKAFEWLRPLLKPVRMLDGAYVFREGDPANRFFVMLTGEVLLEQTDVTLKGEQIFGEIGFFSDDLERAVSARCIGPCEIMSVDEAAFMRLFNQNPAFGLYMLKLTATRLLESLRRNPNALSLGSLRQHDPAGETGKLVHHQTTPVANAEGASSVNDSTRALRPQRLPSIRNAAKRANAIASTL